MNAPTRHVPSAVREVLAWCAAVLYPVGVFLVVLNWQSAGVDARKLVLLVLLAGLPVALLLRRPLPGLALVLCGPVAVVVAVPNEGDWAGIGAVQTVVACLAVSVVAAARPARITVGAAVGALAVLTWAATYDVSGAFAANVAMTGLGLLAAAMVGAAVRQRGTHARELRAHATAQAITAERLRIARELHDMVAHSIGVIAIQAGTGRRIIDTQPEQARTALAAIETSSRETLAGLRRMLGALRQAEAETPPMTAPGLADLDRLVADTGRAGVRVEVAWRGQRRPLPPEVDLATFRIIQEGVTNVARHAGVSECRVLIELDEDALSVEVVDDGVRAGRSGSGFGITGMAERVGLLGGAFAAGPRAEGGFRVAARLPLPEPGR